MAQVNIGEEQTPGIPTEPVQVPDPIQEPIGVTIPDPEPKPEEEQLLPPSDKIIGLTAEELKDPNKISVTIADKDAPIVVLFGPPACGKTMTLVRLTRFLRENGYTITPIRTFRPNYDPN